MFLNPIPQFIYTRAFSDSLDGRHVKANRQKNPDLYATAFMCFRCWTTGSTYRYICYRDVIRALGAPLDVSSMDFTIVIKFKT